MSTVLVLERSRSRTHGFFFSLDKILSSSSFLVVWCWFAMKRGILLKCWRWSEVPICSRRWSSWLCRWVAKLSGGHSTLARPSMLLFVTCHQLLLECNMLQWQNISSSVFPNNFPVRKSSLHIFSKCHTHTHIDLLGAAQLIFDYPGQYHAQISQWLEQPVSKIIKWLKDRSPSLVSADFGCGETLLSAFKLFRHGLVPDSHRIVSTMTQQMLASAWNVKNKVFSLNNVSSEKCLWQWNQ